MHRSKRLLSQIHPWTQQFKSKAAHHCPCYQVRQSLVPLEVMQLLEGLKSTLKVAPAQLHQSQGMLELPPSTPLLTLTQRQEERTSLGLRNIPQLWARQLCQASLQPPAQRQAQLWTAVSMHPAGHVHVAMHLCGKQNLTQSPKR